MLNLILVEDEAGTRKVIKSLLTQHAQDITLIAEATNVKEAVSLINKHNPAIILLDISLPDGKGFDILELIEPYPFKLIFITAHEEFALQAIKHHALDYIVKPILSFDFHKAIKFAIANTSTLSEKFERICVHTIEGIEFVSQKDIVYLQSDSNYTQFNLKNKDVIIASKTMGSFENALSSDFMRVHKSYIVNSKAIKKINKTDLYVTLNTGVEIPISKTKKDELLRRMGVV